MTAWMLFKFEYKLNRKNHNPVWSFLMAAYIALRPSPF